MVWKKVVAGIVAGLIVGGAAFGAIGNANLNEVELKANNLIAELNSKIATLNQRPVSCPTPIVCDEPIVCEICEEVNETLTTEVIEDPTIGLMNNFIIDTEGSLDFLIDGIDTDNPEEIGDAIVFINDAVKIGADEIKAEFADEIDKLEIVVNNETITFDEDDIERIKVKDDLDKLVFEDFDFEDKDLVINYKVEFEFDDIDYKADVIVEFKDGEIDDFDIENVELDE